MPSSRLKQSSTTRRLIGIDGLRAASVRSSTGFAPRHIFSARHDCDLGADIRCGASQSEAISREHRQAITQVESAHWGCRSCSGAPDDRIESESKRQRWEASWDRLSPAIQNAKSGRTTTRDGESQTRTVSKCASYIPASPRCCVLA